MTETQYIAFVASRVFAASVWYGAEFFLVALLCMQKHAS